MRRIQMTLAAAVAAAALTAAPAQAADPLDEVKRAAKCAAEALAGHTCH